jgi:hypothetical protein
MTDPQGQPEERLSILARLVLIGLILLTIVGIIRYGVTIAVIQRIWWQLVERPTRPLAFRFILQPVMAAAAAFLRARRDARAGRSPYFWTAMSGRQDRMEGLREALNATARIILLGLVMDVIYQIIVLKRFYPAESVIIAILLGFVPYVVFRGVFTRIWRRWWGGGSAHQG